MMLLSLIFSINIFAQCPSVVQGQYETVEKFSDAKCSTMDDIFKLAEVTLDECGPYKKSKCHDVFEKSYGGAIDKKTFSEANRRVLLEATASSVNALYAKIKNVGTSLDTEISALNECTVSKIDKFSCAELLKKMGITSESVSKKITESDAIQSNGLCITPKQYDAAKGLANNQGAMDNAEKFLVTKEGKEFSDKLKGYKGLDFKKFVAEETEKLPKVVKLKHKLFIADLQSNYKLKAMFSTQLVFENYIKDFKDPKDIKTAWANEVKEGCEKKFKELEATLCSIKDTESFVFKNEKKMFPAYLGNTENDRLKADNRGMEFNYLRCEASTIVDESLLFPTGEADFNKALSQANVLEVDAKNEAIKDICELVADCKDQPFNCWIKGCSGKGLKSDQENYCNSLGKVKNGVFSASGTDAVNILKAPLYSQETDFRSELSKFFLDPKPSTSTYVAQAQKNKTENEKIYKENHDDGLGFMPKPNEKQTNVIGENPNSPTKNNFNYKANLNVGNQNLSRTTTGSTTTNTEVVPEVNNEGPKADNGNNEDIIDAQNEIKNRLNKHKKYTSTYTPKKENEKKAGDNEEVSNYVAPVDNTRVDKTEPLNEDKKPTTVVTNPAVDNSKRIGSSGSGLLSGSTQDATNRVSDALRKAQIDDKNSVIKATMTVDNIEDFKDVRNVDIIKEQLQKNYADHMKKGMRIELTLKQKNSTKEILMTFFPKIDPDSGKFIYVASTNDPSEDAALLVDRFNHESTYSINVALGTGTNKKKVNPNRTKASDMPTMTP